MVLVHRNLFLRDAPVGTILPDEYNVLFSDISPENLATKVSKALHCQYLSQSSSTVQAEVQGRLYGPNLRSMFTLPVTCKEVTYNVHFLFDTGSPATFLSQSALKGWQIPDWDIDNHTFRINGSRIRPSCSNAPVWNQDRGQLEKSRFEGVNLLGMDYLFKSDAVFTVNPRTNSCCLFFH